MFFLKAGIAKTPIDIGEYLVKCPSCESDQWADIMILSNYYYFLFIPIFPTGKEVNIICKKCGLKRYGASFDQRSINNYSAIKNHYRHPWFTWIGTGIAISVVLLIIIFQIVNK